MRAWAFGEAPAGTAKPYATWQLISAVPDNMLTGSPPVESHRVQVDVWAATSTSADTVAAAIRDCLEASGHLLSFGTDKDAETGSFRVTADYQLWISR